jgi:hypothetical protein
MKLGIGVLSKSEMRGQNGGVIYEDYGSFGL